MASFFDRMVTCPQCQGSGKWLFSKKCPRCQGKRKVRLGSLSPTQIVALGYAPPPGHPIHVGPYSAAQFGLKR